MSKSSLQLIAECQRRGLLSKEAAAQILESRERLIKQAMFGGAKKLIRSMREAPEVITAKPAQSFFSKLKSGGLTPIGVPNEAGKMVRPDTGWTDVAANLGKMMALAGLTAGAATGASAVMRHSRDKQLRNDIAKSYGQMFDEHPDLNDLEESDPGRVQRHFGVLAKFAPSLAADPIVAGTWVKATAQVGQINTGDIKNLAEIQNRIDDTREDHGAIKMAPMRVSDFAQKAMLG